MPSVFTLQGIKVSKKKAKRGGGLGTSNTVGDRKCVFNPRTKQWRPQAYVGISKKHPSGWSFVEGPCKP